jgi:hypothetical protein
MDLGSRPMVVVHLSFFNYPYYEDMESVRKGIIDDFEKIAY